MPIPRLGVYAQITERCVMIAAMLHQQHLRFTGGVLGNMRATRTLNEPTKRSASRTRYRIFRVELRVGKFLRSVLQSGSRFVHHWLEPAL
jgi:hypothetical protein